MNLGSQDILPIPLATAEIYIFSADGLPLPGVSTQVEGEIYSSDNSGLITFEVPSGLYTLNLLFEGKVVAKASLNLRFDLPNELILRLKPEGELVQSQTEESESTADQVPQEERPMGILSGVIVHIETGKPVSGVLVLLRGLDQDVRTDTQGVFTAQVPVGSWTLSLVHPEFATQTLADVLVHVNAQEKLAFQLTPSAIQMESMKVLSGTDIKVQGGLADLLEESKNSSVVLNLIGAEQISKTGDSDAAQALSRVTGLTVVEGKYVVVRGMGDRYSSTTMNGARLPSPDMDKRVVPLDLFPTTVIESLAVQKTYSPERTGDFGGGTVTIRTLGIPEDRFQRRLKGSYTLSLTWDPDTFLKSAPLGQSGAWDILGMDDGTRRLPQSIQDVGDSLEPYNPLAFEGFTDEEIQIFGRSFQNTWAPKPQLILPDLSTSLSLRDKWNMDTFKSFGWAFSVLYKLGFSQDEDRMAGYNDEAGKYKAFDYQQTTTGKEVDLGTLLNLKYLHKNLWDLESTTFATRLTKDKFSQLTGYYRDAGDIQFTETEWVEQSLLNQRVGVGFLVPGSVPLNFHGQYAFSYAQRYEPDHKFLYYDRESLDDPLEWSDRIGRTTRLFNNVQDFIHDGSLKVTLPMGFLGRTQDSLEAGWQTIVQTRTSDTRRFSFTKGQDIDDFILGPDELFQPENIGRDLKDGVKFSESTLSTDNYTAAQTLLAGFVNSDLKLWGLRLNAGARFEYSKQQVDTFDLFSGLNVGALLVNFDTLPAFSLSYDLGKNWKVRAAGSQTVNRPDLRELSPAPKDGAPGEGQYQGNPDLQRALILNGDLRLENYINQVESWSLGGFYKDFKDPIEIYQKAGAGSVKIPINVPKASNIGLELEWQFTLRYFAELIQMWDHDTENFNAREFLEHRQRRGNLNGFFRDLTFSGNLSWIQSQIDYAGQSRGVTTSEVRPLQGQSPYVININLGYKNGISWLPDAKSDTSLALSYNLFGPRLVDLGSEGFPDSYEQPFHQVDLVAKHRFNEWVSMDFKVKNLLDPPSQVKAGNLILEEKKKGRSFSLGLKVDF